MRRILEGRQNAGRSLGACPTLKACPTQRARTTQRACTTRGERGQSFIESTLVMLAFFSLLFAIIDFGQVLVAHQALVERVRAAVRWGVVRPWDGTGDQIASLILYDRADEPRAATDGYLGLKRENVQIRYQPAMPARPDDETLTVAIVNYHYHFISPWVGEWINPRPVLIASPMAYRETAQR